MRNIKLVNEFYFDEYQEVEADRIEDGCKLNTLQMALDDPSDTLIHLLANRQDAEAGRIIREMLAEHIDYELWRKDVHSIPGRKLA